MVKFSLPLTQFLTSFTSSSVNPSVQHNGGFIYTLLEGEIPPSEWFDQFENSSTYAVSTAYASEFEGKLIAYIRFRSSVTRTDILKGKVAIPASSGEGFVYDFVEEGTPNWFILSEFDRYSNTTNNIPYFSAVGQIGSDKDLQLTKSPLTEYSEVSVSDILISNID